MISNNRVIITDTPRTASKYANVPRTASKYANVPKTASNYANMPKKQNLKSYSNSKITRSTLQINYKDFNEHTTSTIVAQESDKSRKTIEMVKNEFDKNKSININLFNDSSISNILAIIGENMNKKLNGWGDKLDLFDIKLSNTINNKIEDLFRLNFNFLKEKFTRFINPDKKIDFDSVSGDILSAIINGSTKLILCTAKNLETILKKLKSYQISNDFSKLLEIVLKTVQGQKYDKEKLVNYFPDIRVSSGDKYFEFHPILSIPSVKFDLKFLKDSFENDNDLKLFLYYLKIYFLFIKDNYTKEFDEIFSKNSKYYKQVIIDYSILVLIIKSLILKKYRILQFQSTSYIIPTTEKEKLKDNDIGIYLHQYLEGKGHSKMNLNFKKDDSILIKLNRIPAINNYNKYPFTNKIALRETDDQKTLKFISDCFLELKIDTF